MHFFPIEEGGRGSRDIHGTLRNSLKTPNGKIWLIDNESTFFYGYKSENGINRTFTQSFRSHDKMLKTMCLFQSSVVAKLRELSKHPSAFQHLWNYASFFEPLFKNFKKDHRLILISKIFNTRLDDIILWIDHCKELNKVQH